MATDTHVNREYRDIWMGCRMTYSSTLVVEL